MHLSDKIGTRRLFVVLLQKQRCCSARTLVGNALSSRLYPNYCTIYASSE